ncbi:hypothetical protein PEB0122_004990 [Bartonella apis]|nr:hypothetical protein PEB0122_004990 [Bartonella apis]
MGSLIAEIILSVEKAKSSRAISLGLYRGNFFTNLVHGSPALLKSFQD